MAGEEDVESAKSNSDLSQYFRQTNEETTRYMMAHPKMLHLATLNAMLETREAVIGVEHYLQMQILDLRKERNGAGRLDDERYDATRRMGLLNANTVVSIFGGALTLPILTVVSDARVQSVLVISFLFFGATTISCLFWLMRLNFADLGESGALFQAPSKFFAVVSLAHSLFNVIGLTLLASTTLLYSFPAGVVCIAFMGITSLVYVVLLFDFLSKLKAGKRESRRPGRFRDRGVRIIGDGSFLENARMVMTAPPNPEALRRIQEDVAGVEDLADQPVNRFSVHALDELKGSGMPQSLERS